MLRIRECTERKEVVDFLIDETRLQETALPADYSFFGYRKLQPVGVESARISRLGVVPERSKEGNKLLTSSIWLNNNKLTGIRGLDSLVGSILSNAGALKWVDFSFNYIKGIDDIILKFPNLAILNFHGNKIEDITQIAKLGKLKRLRNVTFHGNPIEKSVIYREIIVAYLPKLCHLDYSPILKSDRLKALHPDAIKYIRCSNKQTIKEEGKPKDEVKSYVELTRKEKVMNLYHESAFRPKAKHMSLSGLQGCACSCSL